MSAERGGGLRGECGGQGVGEHGGEPPFPRGALCPARRLALAA